MPFLSRWTTVIIVAVLLDFLVPQILVRGSRTNLSIANTDHHKPYVVVDKVRPIKPINQHGTIILNVFTSPDWSDVRLDGRVRFLEAMLFVDAETSRFYMHDMKKIKQAVMSLIEGVNMFLYQIDLRILVVDIRAMPGNNISLEQFLAYRNSEISNFPSHDFAMLLRHRYEGGIAYVNGICGRSAVGLSGFFPEAPMEYASVFFHELAHLLGMPHDGTADCYCSNKRKDEPCLRIEGYDNDCSVQALANRLHKHQCINNLPMVIPQSTIAFCGNGIVEDGEQCDCGPEKYCHSLLCIPQTCTQRIANFWLYLILFVISSVSLALACCACKRFFCHKSTKRRQFERQRSTLQSKSAWSNLPPGDEFSTLPSHLPNEHNRLANLNSTLTNVISASSTMPVRIAPPPPRPPKPQKVLSQSTDNLSPPTASPIVPSSYSNTSTIRIAKAKNLPATLTAMTLDRAALRQKQIEDTIQDYVMMNPHATTDAQHGDCGQERPHTYQEVDEEEIKTLPLNKNTQRLKTDQQSAQTLGRRLEISAPIPFIIASKKVNPKDFVSTRPTPPLPPAKMLITIDDVVPVGELQMNNDVEKVKEKLKRPSPIQTKTATTTMSTLSPAPPPPPPLQAVKPKLATVATLDSDMQHHPESGTRPKNAMLPPRFPPKSISQSNNTFDDDPIYDLPPNERDYEEPRSVVAEKIKKLDKLFERR